MPPTRAGRRPWRTPLGVRTNIVLIDYENVRPASLEPLLRDHFRVVIFVGAHQSKLPFEVADAMQKLGSRGEYVKIIRNGSNALDFHIAYYMGVFAAADPTAHFHIVSNDGGFDPLIEHLKTKKIQVRRVSSVAEIVAVKGTCEKSTEEQIQLVIDRLAKSNATRPGKVKALTNSIASIFNRQLRGEEIAAIIAGLQDQSVIAVGAGGKITYPVADDA